LLIRYGFFKTKHINVNDISKGKEDYGYIELYANKKKITKVTNARSGFTEFQEWWDRRKM